MSARAGGPSDVPIRYPTTPARVHAFERARVTERPDALVTEEPMEIRVQGPGQEPRSLAVTMRTPGHDFELAAGFCLTEGLIDGPGALTSIGYCLDGSGQQQYNIVTVRLRRAVEPRPREFVASSSCGLCGKAALDDIEVACGAVRPGPVIAAQTVTELPARLRAAQRVFDATGGLHAAAIFHADGALLTLREDIGRHNATDKVIGHALLERRLPLADQVLLVSGRLSFEIVQKAAVAGIPVLCAVSAPSGLAVRAAERLDQTVIGFLRGDRFNVYSHRERVAGIG